MSDSITEGKLVEIHYTMRDERGEVIESTEGDGPVEYVHGSGSLVPGLVEALEGRTPGAELEVTVPPEHAFGRRRAGEPQVIPKSTIPDTVPLRRGVSFMATTGEGRRLRLWITGVAEREVVVDASHPLAGRVLHFEVEVLDVREPAER